MKMILKYLWLFPVIIFASCQTSPSNEKGPQAEQKDTIPKDAVQIDYKEVKQFNLKADALYAIDVKDGNLYLAYDKVLVTLNKDGGEVAKAIATEGEVKSIVVADDQSIYLLHKNFFVKMNAQGNPLFKSDEGDEKSVFTSMDYSDEYIFVADAGNRRVLRYSLEGDLLGEIMGVFNGKDDRKGFIVPSPYFDLAIDKQNELWVVNPGMHAIQQYSPEGNLLYNWENAGNALEGFQGCCNPAHMTMMDDGRFVTAEKGHVRIKIYSQTGKLDQIVAVPESFTGNHAPDIAVEGNTIYALDFDQKKVRVFELKSNE